MAAPRKSAEILAGAMEASTLPDRRNSSHLRFCGLPASGHSRLLDAACRRLQEFRYARLVRKSRSHLRLVTDYAATIVFLCMVIAVIRRLVFKPARYAVPAKFGKRHTADAIFLLSLIALLMLADSLFAAAAAQSQPGSSVEVLAAFSLPWLLKVSSPQLPCPLLGDSISELILSMNLDLPLESVSHN